MERARLDGQLLLRSSEMEALFKISSILGQPGSYEQKLHGVMQELASVAEAHYVSVLVPDLQEGGLRTVVRVRKDGSSLPLHHFAQGLAISVFESGQAVVSNDYQSSSDQDQSAIDQGAKSVMSIPVKGTEETLAVASIVSDEVDHFNPERVRLLTAIVDGLGVLMEKARLDGQLLQRTEELEALFKISSILGQPGLYEQKLNRVINEAP